jgi:hypothetical protein
MQVLTAGTNNWPEELPERTLSGMEYIQAVVVRDFISLGLSVLFWNISGSAVQRFSFCSISDLKLWNEKAAYGSSFNMHCYVIIAFIY